MNHNVTFTKNNTSIEHYSYNDLTGYVGMLKDGNKEILIISTIPMGEIEFQDNAKWKTE